MVLLEFSMSPLGKSESVGKYVSRSLDLIDRSGVDYRLNPMGTVLEGEWDECLTSSGGAFFGCDETATEFPARSSWTIAKATMDGWPEKRPAWKSG